MANAADDAYPSKTITIVVPFSPGGGVDVMARLLAEKLRASLNQTVVVDNKPGASGMLGALAVVRAPANGYTLLLGSAGETAINPFVYKSKMQYTPAKDLTPITLIVRVPNVLVASPGAPFSTVDELVAYAKKNPKQVKYATSGIGNGTIEKLQTTAAVETQMEVDLLRNGGVIPSILKHTLEKA